MLTSLDLLIIVFMALAALTMLSLGLMFLLKSKTAQKIIFYIALILGLYLSRIGLRIGFGGGFPVQITVGILTALACAGAFVWERVSNGNAKAFLLARIVSAAALIVAFGNAIL